MINKQKKWQKWLLSTGLFGICCYLFVSLLLGSSCGGGDVGNPPAELGYVEIGITLREGQLTPLPSQYRSGGICSNRTVAANMQTNLLKQAYELQNSPVAYFLNWSLHKELPSLGREQGLLRVEVDGDNGHNASYTFSNTEIKTTTWGTNLHYLPIPVAKNTNSRVIVTFLDVCCSSNNKRVEWKTTTPFVVNAFDVRDPQQTYSSTSVRNIEISPTSSLYSCN